MTIVKTPPAEKTEPVFRPHVDESGPHRLSGRVVDLMAIVIGAGAIFLWSFQTSGKLPPPVFEGVNRYFHADSARYYANMTTPLSSHHGRTKVHPLFSLLSGIPTQTMTVLTGMEAKTAVRVLLACAAAMWIAALFVLLRLSGLATLDAAVFTTLAGVSASAIFWFVVPETFSLGATSMLLPLIVFAARAHRPMPAMAYVLASAASLSVTTTNWMVGLLTTWLDHPWRIAVRLSIYAFFAVTVLWGVQKAIFPSAQFFLSVRGEAKFMRPLTARNVAYTSRSFFLDTMFIPQPSFARDKSTDRLNLTLNNSGNDSGLAPTSGWKIAGMLLWIGLLVLAARPLTQKPQLRRFRQVVLLLIGAQLGLHLIYGDELFLYSLHFAPLLVIFTACTCATRLRMPALGLACALIPCAAINNLQVFDTSVDAIRRNQLDPVGGAHVAIGIPNSPDIQKTFVESEGVFSPGFDSFGVYFWIFDHQSGKLTAPTMDRIRHRRGLPEKGELLPWSQWTAGDVVVTTEVCQISTPASGGSVNVAAARAHLTNTAQQERKLSLYVALRGLGPAGGPVKRLTLSEMNDALFVADRPGLIANEPASAAGVSDSDNVGELATSGRIPQARTAVSPDGVCSGVLRYDLSLAAGASIQYGFICPILAAHQADDRWSVDFYRSLNVDELFREARSFWSNHMQRIKVDAPDPRWSQGLNAMLGHIAMALNEDAPEVAVINYHVFTRDAVYMINVLQKGGQFELAGKSIDHLLNHPFSGRPYPEADSPGQLLWIMGEQWRLARDKEWLEQVCPKVTMLASLIEYYRTTDGPHWVQKDALAFGGSVPRDKRSQLQPGRCDGHHPEYTEAFDIAGVRAASLMAAALGKHADAARFERLAAQLFTKYDTRFGARLAVGYGKYSVLWPCRLYGFGGRSVLDQFRDNRAPTPGSWRYFPLAKAHQSLFAGNRAAAFGAVLHHLEHDQLRGWYAFDEGGKSLTGLWRQARTQWNPEVAMPHGWATAEMWLLMRDSLLFEEDERLVLFAGVPENWFTSIHGMRLEKMPTWFGECSVQWEPNSQGASLKLGGKAAPPKGFLLCLPPALAAKVFVDDTLQELTSGMVAIPQYTREVVVQFDRRP